MARPTRICVFCSSRNGNSTADVGCARDLARVLQSKNIQLVYGGGTGGLMGELARERVRLGGTPDTVMGVVPVALMDDERGVGCSGAGSRLKGRGWKGVGAEGSSKGETKGGSFKLKDFIGKHKSKERERMKEGGMRDTSVIELPTDPVFGQVVGVKSLSARKAMMIRLVDEGGPGSGFLALSGGFGTLDEVAEVVTLGQRGVHSKRMVLVNIEGFWDGIMMWMTGARSRGMLRLDDGQLAPLSVASSAEEAVGILAQGEEEQV